MEGVSPVIAALAAGEPLAATTLPCAASLVPYSKITSGTAPPFGATEAVSVAPFGPMAVAAPVSALGPRALPAS